MGVNHRLSQAPQQGRGASMILLLLLLPFCQAVPKPHPTSPALVGSEGNEAVADDYSDQQPHEWAHPSLVGSENHLNRQLPNPPTGFHYPSSNLDLEEALASDYSDYIGTDNNMDYHFHFPHTRPRPNGGGGRLNRGDDYQTDNNMDYHFHFPHTRPRPRPNGGGGRLNRGCNSWLCGDDYQTDNRDYQFRPRGIFSGTFPRPGPSRPGGTRGSRIPRIPRIPRIVVN